jgi:hypothetical protein
MLRLLGCRLPVELWHVGPEEVDAEMRRLVEPLGVRSVDAADVARRHPVRFLSGWPLKAFALLHSGFSRALLLDADNLPLVDPTFLFDSPQFRSCGAVMWPDSRTCAVEDAAWTLTGVPYREEPEVESGQVLVDRRACRGPVALASWMNNRHADFWYDHLYGDKDTFRLAWRKLNAPFAMPLYPPTRLKYAIWQHDFDGRPIFQHRFGNKWRLESQHLLIPGFLFQEECRQFLRDLRERWAGRPGAPYRHDAVDDATRLEAEHLCRRRWLFTSESGERRTMTFGIDGTVREGRGDREEAWNLFVHPFDATLSLTGDDGVAWQLCRAGDEWMGQAPGEHHNAARLVPVGEGRQGKAITAGPTLPPSAGRGSPRR